jgi:hypothetical protein
LAVQTAASDVENWPYSMGIVACSPVLTIPGT